MLITGAFVTALLVPVSTGVISAGTTVTSGGFSWASAGGGADSAGFSAGAGVGVVAAEGSGAVGCGHGPSTSGVGVSDVTGLGTGFAKRKGGGPIEGKYPRVGPAQREQQSATISAAMLALLSLRSNRSFPI